MIVDEIVCRLCGETANVGYAVNEICPDICGKCSAEIEENIKINREKELAAMPIQDRLRKIEARLDRLEQREETIVFGGDI